MRDRAGEDEEEMSTLAFGALRFDPASGELTGPAGVERIAPQPASLLALLASRPGAVVGRDEIREHLWPGGKVEFEQGIAFAVREVRRAIESVGGDPAVLETIPKRGFRLIVTSAVPAHPSRPARRMPTRRLVALVAAVVVVVVAFASALARDPGRPAVVVVFEHATEDPAYATLARDVGFELTAALTRAFAGRLGIIGPMGTASLAGPDDTDGARASLGACLVVSGGLRAVGPDSVVVFTQVVRTLDRVHAWARQDTVAVTAAATVVPGVVGGVEESASAC
jgi:DNA-binding winged helix-turn-helix (wHTH) protein/TolB-like protein